MTNTKTHYDIIISGGGLTGAAMALSLFSKSCKPLRIAIVDSADKQQASGGFDERVIALSYGSAEYLQQLGAWTNLKNDACAIKNIHVSDRSYYGKARIDSQDYQLDALGYVAPLQSIASSLYAQLQVSVSKDSVIDEYFANGIESIDWQRNQVNVELQQGLQLSAELLLACDGGHSKCRQLAKIDTQSKDYGQVAIVANVKTALPHQHKAFERFSETGPIAMLPMTDNRCSLVWTLSPQQAQDHMALTDEEFADTLQAAFGDWLGPFTKIGKRQSFGLKLVHAKQITQHRMALLGNACHTLHPIAGQGFNLSIRDVACMSSLVSQALKNGEDLGEFALLNAYQQQRMSDQKAIIQLTDALVHCFSNHYLPLVIGRNIGLKALNYMAGIKASLANTTMGHIGS
ncbi:2-octaprenyl-6-methoxyphenyl hydroxylase [Thalassotalea sp. PS06]|uniref:2-octaprenyl-6-methoxyphenyl hydroxylase n=1 Tax=Thalassotalea sp. PS06 TaxID=2594005 RepID=UPI0011634B21|nr:2-octaprenyl-6-methoxyphenyl hydroxylase [Thalassotalea sp. PS06]QDP00442.1 2-octaprenyl-6-methoxyphenyl hydroxylase [Thalassotalea sp. PS06]